jgi:hypothetical protein
MVAATWLWRCGVAPLRLPVAAAYLIGSGAALTSQNAQLNGIPSAMVIAFLIYDALRQHPRGGRLDGVAAAPLLVLLAFPLAFIAASALSLAAYRINAESDKMVRVIDRTNLKGLAVPAEPDGVLAGFAAGNGGYALFNRTRAVIPQFDMSPFEYVQTILEAADLMAGKRYLRGVALLDQVNPMPFVLGMPPSRGANLWLADTKDVPPVERFFADVDYVLIPKFSTHNATKEVLRAAYEPYLKEHFRHSEESQSWFLLSRDGPLDK